MTKWIPMVVLAAAPLIAMQHVIAQEKIELKATTISPPTHFFVADFLQPWGNEIAKRTGGNVTVRVFAGNSPFGNAANQADQVAAGVTDVSFSSNGFPRGRLPRTLIMEMPLVASDAAVASKTLWSMRDSHLADDYKGFKVLGLLCGTGIGYFTRDKKIDRIEDLKGLRIRVLSPQSQATVQHFGAVPVSMPSPQIYESLEKRIIDGAIMGYDGVVGFRLEGLFKYSYPAKMFVACYHAVMNPRKYDSLPAAARKAIDETTGDSWVVSFPRSWDKSEQASRAVAVGKGMVEAQVAPELHAKWRAELKSVIDEQLAETEKQGVPNARAIYEEMLKRASQFAK